ncbi:MAG: acyl-CoA thioesterase [Micrococcales bacterium]|nr:acyl-CoA thioesterase [Micrococcales bacterium]
MLVPADSYHVDIALRWGDMDAYNHVNNVTYLQYLEQARVIAFRDWFGQDRSILDEGILVARSEIEYRAPLSYRDAPVRVSLWCSHIGGGSYDLAYVVHDPEGVGDGAYAVAETTLALYDFATERPRRMSGHEKAALTEHLADPAPMRRRR